MYKPLRRPNNIRLLHIEPAERSEPLRGSLVECEAYETAPDEDSTNSSKKSKSNFCFEEYYEALSYAWGVNPERTWMDIDGAQVEITESLRMALTHLRCYTSRKLWIDQICINQCDDVEKSGQVQMMLDIFASADRVHAWLGLPNEKSDAGITALWSFCHGPETICETAWHGSPTEFLCTGLEDILSRTWFQRIWVVQEAAVAKEVVMHCGFHRLSWTNSVEQVLFFSRAVKAAAISPQWKEAGLDMVDPEWRRGVAVNYSRSVEQTYQHFESLMLLHMRPSRPKWGTTIKRGLDDLDVCLSEILREEYRLEWPERSIFEHWPKKYCLWSSAWSYLVAFFHSRISEARRSWWA